MAGYSSATNGQNQAFYWTQGGGLLGLLGDSQAFGVNNGTVVGSYNGNAFRWTPGTGVVTLDDSDQANSINSSGAVLGTIIVGGNYPGGFPFFWSAANVVTLAYPGEIRTAVGLNDVGHFVGISFSGRGYESDGITVQDLGSFWPTSLSNNGIAGGSTGGVATYENFNDNTDIGIGVLSGDATSNALGVNPLGTQIVGVSDGHGGFIYDIATANLQSLTSLVYPAFSGWSILSGNAINDYGQIVGVGEFNGVQQAVLLTPVPEPSTLVLAFAAFVGLLAVKARRQAGKSISEFSLPPRRTPIAGRVVRKMLVLVLGVVALLAENIAFAGPLYEVTDLGVLPGYVSSTATSVDSDGEVVGYNTDASGNTQAFYWTQSGGMIPVGGANSKAFGVNGGNVVGVTGTPQAFRWTSGTGTVLLDPSNYGQANGVNSGGEVVGYRDLGGTDRAITWSASNTISNLFPASNLTGAALNDAGHFVGLQSTAAGYFSNGTSFVGLGTFLPASLSNTDLAAGSQSNLAAYENILTSSITPIGTLSGDTISKALGIDPLGTQIVGLSQGHGGFLYEIGTSDLESLNSLLAADVSSWSVLTANSIQGRWADCRARGIWRAGSCRPAHARARALDACSGVCSVRWPAGRERAPSGGPQHVRRGEGYCRRINDRGAPEPAAGQRHLAERTLQLRQQCIASQPHARRLRPIRHDVLWRGVRCRLDFPLNTDGAGYAVVHSFSASEGSHPIGSSLALDGNTLYGTTTSGGAYNYGTIFAITVPEPSGIALTTIGLVGLAAFGCRGRRSRRSRFRHLSMPLVFGHSRPHPHLEQRRGS